MMPMLSSRLRAHRNDEGSLMLVFLVILVVSAMASVVLVTAVSGNKVSRHAEAYNEVLPRADVGVQKALFALINGGATGLPTNSASPAPLSGGTSTGSWYVTHPAALEYDVVSTSTQNGVSRTVTAKLIDQPRFPLAAFADATITFRGNNAADSYDHRSLQTNTGNGDAGSNGSIVFNGNASADGVTLYDYLTNASGTRCSGTPCANLTTVGPKLDISSSGATAFISNAVAACQSAGPLTAWVASQNGGVLTPGTHCYSSMAFDIDTTNLGTDLSPTIIYVTGSVSVEKMTNVNIPASPAVPDPQALQIYALGSSVAIGNHSAVGAAIWAPHAACGGNPSNAQANVWGSLVCSDISNQGGWSFHYDDALTGIGTGQWTQNHYAEPGR